MCILRLVKSYKAKRVEEIKAGVFGRIQVKTGQEISAAWLLRLVLEGSLKHFGSAAF